MENQRVQKALFSLNNPHIAEQLATLLIGHGWQIVATDETVAFLASKNIPSKSIYDFLELETKYSIPPTLHPQIEVSLSMDQEDKNAFDLVFDQTYGLEQGIDIGGHTLIGLGIKGNRFVLTDEEDARLFVRYLENGSPDPESLRYTLRQKALKKISSFYTSLSLVHRTSYPLANGENPYQVPAEIIITNETEQLGIGQFENLSEQEPCYTNVADLDSLTNLLITISKTFFQNFARVPYISIAAKHGNACGCAISWKEKAETVEKALRGNPLAVWGGELVTNFEFDSDLASKAISSDWRKANYGSEKWMLDIIATPGYSDEAKGALLKRNFRKVYSNEKMRYSHEATFSPMYRQIKGGELHQPAHDFILEIPSGYKGNHDLASNFIIAWCTVFWSFHGGNEVALARDGQLLSCAGGPSTVDAAQTAVQRAKHYGHTIDTAVFAADAFFPYIDAPEILVGAGCTYGIVPKGGIRFNDVASYFKENKVACIYLNETIRGFCKH